MPKNFSHDQIAFIRDCLVNSLRDAKIVSSSKNTMLAAYGEGCEEIIVELLEIISPCSTVVVS